MGWRANNRAENKAIFLSEKRWEIKTKNKKATVACRVILVKW
jgi:hypothetical protein